MLLKKLGVELGSTNTVWCQVRFEKKGQHFDKIQYDKMVWISNEVNFCRHINGSFPVKFFITVLTIVVGRSITSKYCVFFGFTKY